MTEGGLSLLYLYLKFEKIFSCQNHNDIVSEFLFLISNLYEALENNKPIKIKILKKSLHYKLLLHPDLYFGEAYTNGDIEIEKTKKLVEAYFGDIPNNGEVPVRETIIEDPITETIKITEYDSNIQIPAKAFLYRTPGMNDRDSYVLQYISAVLTGGKSSRMVKRMVDDEKLALQVIAFNQPQQDYGKYLMLSLPVGDTSLEKLMSTMDEEIEKIKSELISEREYEKVKNQFEVQYIQSNTRIEGIANSLARAHMLYGDINIVNDEVNIYRSITREEIKEVANKYLNKNQRIEVDYLAKK